MTGMKRLIVMLLLLAGSAWAIDDIEELINTNFPTRIMAGPRVGFLSYYDNVYAGKPGVSSILPLGFSVEIPLEQLVKTDETYLKPISVGFLAMFQSYTYSVKGIDWITSQPRTYNWQFNYTLIAFQGSYYFKIKNKDLIPFAKVHLGYTFYSADYDGFFDHYIGPVVKNVPPSIFGFNLGIGMKWTPLDSLAISAEVGYGLSLIQLGVDYLF